MATADLDLLATSIDEGYRVYVNDGSGAFTDSGQALGVNATTSFARGDTDGVGGLDLVEGDYYEATGVYI